MVSLTFIAGLVAYLSFISGSLCFVIPGKFPVRMLLMAVLNIAATLYNLGVLLNASESLIPVIMFTGATFLFWKTVFTVRRHKSCGLSVAFSHDTPDLLIRSGPFSCIRHPFYSSYLAGFLAPLFSNPDPLSLFFFILMSIGYYSAARSEDNKFTESEFRSSYKKYKKDTGMFFPLPGTLKSILTGSRPGDSLHKHKTQS